METEYKFKIPNSDLAKRIFNDMMHYKYRESSKIETISMHAIYFDSEDSDLKQKGIAYRTRHENDRITVTVKWDSRQNEGLYSREEFNLVIDDNGFADYPNIDIFKSGEVYDILHEAVGDKKLVRTVEMKFNRELLKLDVNDSIVALSFDKGKIKGRTEENPISELEIEWYHGKKENFHQFAKMIMGKYELEPELKSKLQRGFI